MSDYSKEFFSRDLRFLLKSRRMSQLELANALGVSSSIVSDWCKGRKIPRIDRAQRIAAFFGVPISKLMLQEDLFAGTYTLDLDTAEYQHLVAYRNADDIARSDAFEILIHAERASQEQANQQSD